MPQFIAWSRKCLQNSPHLSETWTQVFATDTWLPHEHICPISLNKNVFIHRAFAHHLQHSDRKGRASCSSLPRLLCLEHPLCTVRQSFAPSNACPRCPLREIGAKPFRLSFSSRCIQTADILCCKLLTIVWIGNSCCIDQRISPHDMGLLHELHVMPGTQS